MSSFACPRGVLSLGLMDDAVRLETKCSLLLVPASSVRRTAQALCSHNVGHSRMSQSEYLKVNNSSSLMKSAQVETAALCVQSSLAHLYTYVKKVHPHLQADLSIEKKKTKIDVKGPSPLCLTGNSRDLAHLMVLPSVLLYQGCLTLPT